MLVDVIPSLKEVTPQKIYGKTAIVLDIFRCTSTIVTALANGCSEVIPALNQIEALELAAKLPPETYLMAGEIKGEKIKNFNLGNSPIEFTRKQVEGKKVILTTTNGTKAIRSCKPAKHVLIGSFLNASAITLCAAGYAKDIVIVCAGTRGNISLEDVMGAGFLVSELKKETQDIRLNQLANTFFYLYKYFKEHLNHLLTKTRSSTNLERLGYGADISYCLQKNKFQVVPIFKQNSVKNLKSFK